MTGLGLLLAGGLAVTLLGMFWLSRLSPGTSCLTAIALPTVLVTMGQGGTLTPLLDSVCFVPSPA